MSIEGTEHLGDWGKMIPVNDQVHFTQTNANSGDGLGMHVTTDIPGEQIKVQDRFDENGKYFGSNFAKR